MSALCICKHPLVTHAYGMSALCICKHPLVTHAYGKSVQNLPCQYRDASGRCECRTFSPVRTHLSKGVPRTRLAAVSTCTERSYRPGTILSSTEWQAPRTVVEIQNRSVLLLCSARNKGSMRTRPERVKSFPPDVHKHFDAGGES